ncbi:hypothetical protein CC1G_04029 [Coprinopsis cinerea okayama7|uniref:CHAT domain-containing protein n=1 Tax=Coprinopsis cinerea (strain Okayama-7 / 130 / ATCC MYA-4618 / FGSC 9003) TaxID=240176 RepID=A8N8I2_COPC7|nr:hypothetical protein CC1G_04029 [Coprinopsis cinerea okayama7\|eukprot:XP_001831138.2 hypothetical protein CC1G_04029 [Coprinopsis cinerea okayama7\
MAGSIDAPNSGYATAIDEDEVTSGHTQARDKLEEALSRVNELLDRATKEMDDGVLANAMDSLRETIRHEEEDDGTRAKAEAGLIKALVTRFARYGWVDDMDEGMKLLLRKKSNPLTSIRGAKVWLKDKLNPFIRESPASGLRGKRCVDNISFALNSIRQYRQSVSVSELDTAILVANEALASCHGTTNSRSQLLLRAGNALVLKYLASDDARYLGLAEASFQDARQVLGSGDPTLFTVLLNLQHIVSIKLAECKGEESVRLLELNQLREEMENVDEKGRNAYKLGTQLMQGDKHQLEESLLWFRQSLSFRPPQHPRRQNTLSHCAIALRNRFHSTRDFRDLEESAALHREALDHRPPGHPSRPASLNNLASSLSVRFQHKGDFRDLEECLSLYQEALSVLPEGHPDRHIALFNLASSLSTRFKHKGDYRDLEQGVRLHREALSLRPPSHPNRPHSLNNLAISLSTRFEHKGDFSDLEECLTLYKELLSHRPTGHPDRPNALNNLANSLGTRFKHKGDFRDLEECLTLHREALSLFPSDHPDSERSLNNLANALSTRFKHKGDLRDLEESLELGRKVLSLRGSDHPEYPSSLNNLASSVFTRFQHKGDFCDLEESVRLLGEALSLRPAGHPDRPTSLDNLASMLHTRFKHKGDLCDLEECLELYREAVSYRPPGHHLRPVSLSNLASSLSVCFNHKGNLLLLEECITLHKEALDLRPVGHPDRSMSLNNLAASLCTRFQHKGDFHDLEESVTLYREALDLRPRDHPDRPTPLFNLASALVTLFEHNGILHDVEESVTLLREAVSMLPEGHPSRPIALHNLATSLSTRFQHKGDFHDLEECVILLREALLHRPAGHPDRLASLNNLATSLSYRFKHKGDFRDLEECVTMLREALSLRPPGHPDRPGSLNNLANSLSTRFKHKGDLQDLEECVTLHREALSLLPSPHPERSNPLNNLAESLSTRFKRKGDFRDLEECLTLLREALSLRPPGHPSRPYSLNNLATALSTRFEHKGDLSDLEACIEALREAVLLYSKSDNSLGVKPDSTWTGHPSCLVVIGNLVGVLTRRYLATSDNDTLNELFQLLRSGTQFHGSSPMARLHHAQRWSSACRQFNRPQVALEAYSYGVAILPHLASLDLTLEQRQNTLVWVKDLSRDAVQCAIEQGQLEMAVVFLSIARSVFWSQALQFRGPLDRLDALHPDLAAEVRSVTRQLEIATQETSQAHSTSAMSTRPYLLSQKREEVIARIRATDGFQDFLLPPSFDTLKSAAKQNPIVFLNASKYGCDILILKQDGTLHRHPLSTDLERIAGLTDAIEPLSRGQAAGKQLQRKIDSFCETETRNTRLKLRRKNRGTAEDDFKKLLEILWDVVAEPVIRILGLQKTDNPQRIWWCPTGPFAFLPIHAAGIYANNPEASDCLSDYVVSSYCSSPQDLIAPPPTPNLDYEMLVVVEPGDSGPSRHRLPFTMEELKKIQRRIPHERHLVTRIGSAETPSNPDTILGHINSASIVHFGCHGSQDSSNPLDSSLILSGGCLTMGSLIRGCRTSNAALAYLSACETAMGDQERPDESLSLAATMQFAGFRSVVATMWAIQDEDAPIVADVFYHHLFRRGTAAPPDITDAAYGLHLAVKKLRDLGRPFQQWVPFVHYGI